MLNPGSRGFSGSGIQLLANSPGNAIDKDCQNHDGEASFDASPNLQARDRPNDFVAQSTGADQEAMMTIDNDIITH